MADSIPGAATPAFLKTGTHYSGDTGGGQMPVERRLQTLCEQKTTKVTKERIAEGIAVSR
jgi:hypothetical protein